MRRHEPPADASSRPLIRCAAEGCGRPALVYDRAQPVCRAHFVLPASLQERPRG